jgi:hypothetical protein
MVYKIGNKYQALQIAILLSKIATFQLFWVQHSVKQYTVNFCHIS